MVNMVFILVIVAHIFASDYTCSLVQDWERSSVTSVREKIKGKEITSLEVRWIKNSEYSGLSNSPEVLGAVFSVTDADFWEEFADVMLNSKNRIVARSHKFQAMLSVILSQSLYNRIPGTPLLHPHKIEKLFPIDSVVFWRVGHSDWLLENLFPGTVTLCPGGENYALHFVPRPSPSDNRARSRFLSDEACDDVTDVGMQRQRLEQSLANTEAVLTSFSETYQNLCEQQKELKDDISLIIKKLCAQDDAVEENNAF